MAAQPEILISDVLMQKVEETARAQNRPPAELVTEAVSKYLSAQRWTELVARNERRAKALGITEEDIPRLIAEVRDEKKKPAGD